MSKEKKEVLFINRKTNIVRDAVVRHRKTRYDLLASDSRSGC